MKNIFKYNKLKLIITMIINIFFIATNIYFIISVFKLNNIENLIRYLLITILILIIILVEYLYYLKIKKKKSFLKITIIILIESIILSIINYNFDKVFNILSNFSKYYTTYSSSLITLNENDYKIDNLDQKKVGIIKDETSIEGYIIPKLLIEENNLKIELVTYDSYINIINALYDKEIDLAFLPTSYQNMFSNIEHYQNISLETKIIKSKTKEYEKENNQNSLSKNDLTKPFTILLMGLDSTEDSITSTTAFNGDALLLVTFNPNTLNATILSIPRDTFVPIACFAGNIENKITHAAWNGESCMIDTIQNLTGINIDYYVKINFKGVVELVDALGGINVDVPYNFCEQDSNREWGENTIFVDKGYQTLNGEQALALARHRKEIDYTYSYCGTKYTGNDVSDFKRNENQQKIIEGMLQKIKSIKNINTLYNLLDTISNNIDTNINTNQILSLYNVFKSIIANNTQTDNLINIQKLKLSGYEQYIFDEGMGLTLYEYIYYRGSLKDIVNEMKINLELIEPELIKETSFSINKSYQQPIIGEGTYPVVDYIETIPDFLNKTKSDVDLWSNQKNVTINYLYEESDTNNIVIKQDYQWGYRLKKLPNNTLTITLTKKSETIKPKEYPDCSNNTTDEECLLPDFTDWTIDKFNNWYQELTKYNINMMTPTIIKENDKTKENNLIINQDKEKDTPLNEITSLTITINELIEEVIDEDE